MSSLKFGLIGASYVAASRMMPAFAANGIAPKALFDTDESRFKYWVDADLDLLTSDLDQLLASNIDAVYISSRNDQHAAQAITAADAGKHILLEKPMALTLADARAIVEAADRNGVQLAVNHHLPGSPLHSAARRLVAEGRIGTLYSARINHAVLLPASLGGGASRPFRAAAWYSTSRSTTPRCSIRSSPLTRSGSARSGYPRLRGTPPGRGIRS